MEEIGFPLIKTRSKKLRKAKIMKIYNRLGKNKVLFLLVLRNIKIIIIRYYFFLFFFIFHF